MHEPYVSSFDVNSRANFNNHYHHQRHFHLRQHQTKHRGRKSRIPTRIRMFLGSYLGNEANSSLRLFVDFLSASIAGLVPQIRLRPLPSKSFPIRYSLIKSSFDPLVT